MLSRRAFSKKCAWTAVGSWAGISEFALRSNDFKLAGLKGITFDLHCHPRSQDRFVDLIDRKISGGFLALVADLPLLKRTETGIIPDGTFGSGEAWKEFEGQLSALIALLDAAKITLATSYSDFVKRNQSGQFSPFLACEGGDFIESIEFLEKAYELDLRSVQLVHYVSNDLGDLQTAAPRHGGLSEFGRSVIKKMNDLGMVIDVAHASLETVRDVVEASADPIILSHSILKKQPFMPISARALTEDHAQLISQNGGVIGMWPSGLSNSLEHFVESTKRMIDLVGIDHVGIGTDMDANFKPVITNYTEFITWADLLRERGLSNEEVEKVTGANAARILKAVLKS
jgi:membrane dipeptidase